MFTRRAVFAVAALLAAVASQNLSSQAPRSTEDGLVLLRKVQDALGGATRLAAVRDFEELILAQAWDARGTPLGDVHKRTRWMKSPNVLRLDQRGPRGTYVLYFDGGSSTGWEILPELSGPDPFKTTGKAIALAGGELQFAKAYLSGFELNLWQADQRPGYRVSSSAPNALRIEHAAGATDFTIDPATNLPLKSVGVSLADPDRPVPSETRFEEWRSASGVRFPTRRVSFLSGVKRGEVRMGDIRLDAGLRPQDLAAQPADFAPDLSPWRDESPHQVRWISVDSSVRLEVLDWGGSGPPLVLLGCYLTAHIYDEIAPKLANQFHVYGITRRGVGLSDKPGAGYSVQRSADDVLEVLDAVGARKSLMVGNSCAGQILTLFAAQHSDRLSGLVYLDGAGDPTTPAYDPPMPDPATLPRRARPAPPLHDLLRREPGWLLAPEIRRAITVDARMKPDYTGIRVPVLAIYQAQRPFEEVAAPFDVRSEQERAALRQEYTATRNLYTRWQQDLLTAVPTARIVELPGANLYMFLWHEADVLREIRAFAR